MPRTMEAFKIAVTIRRTPEEVFTFLADFENVPRWNYAIESTTKVSPGPVRRGANAGPLATAKPGYGL